MIRNKLKYIYLFFIISCNQEPLLERSVDLNDIKSIQVITSERSAIIRSNNQLIGNIPFGFPVDGAFVEKWIEQIQGLTNNSSQGFSIIGLKPETIIINGVDFNYLIEAYKNEKDILLMIKGNSDKKKIEKALYVDPENYDSIFKALYHLRANSLSLDFSKVLIYQANDKIYDIEGSSKEDLLKILSSLIFKEYPYYGTVDQSIFNKYKLGQYYNENLLGEFSLDGKKVKFGRDVINSDNMVVWHESWNYVVRFVFKNWRELKEWEWKVLKE